MRKAFILFFMLAMAGAEAKSWRNSVSWPEYAEEAVKVFTERGGDANMALYAEYDFDNDGREELVIYEPKPYEDPSRHVCIFCVNQKDEMQFVVDVPLPLFTYNMQGQGSYVFTSDGKCVQLANSTSRLDTKGEYGDGDGLCMEYHGRRSLMNFDRWGKPLNALREKDLDMSPFKSERNIANVNLYWYRTQPKVKGTVGVAAFFDAICDAIDIPQLRAAQRAVKGDRLEGVQCIIDPAAQYIQVKANETEDRDADRIECTMWKRDDGRHIVALNYSINDFEDFYGEFVNLLFWEYDAQSQSLVPIKEPMERLWDIPNLSYDIRVDLPRHGKNIKVTDKETGEQYAILYQHDEDLITFWSQSIVENTMLATNKGLMCSIYDTSGTPANIRLAPKGKVSKYTMENDCYDLVVCEQKDGYYRIVDNEIENWTADCDNMLFMEDNSTGYWVHRSCVAVMSRHNDGAPLKLLKDWDDCDPQPTVHTITQPTILRPISYSECEGWVKVQTLDGKHTGWVTKDKLGPVRNRK